VHRLAARLLAAGRAAALRKPAERAVGLFWDAELDTVAPRRPPGDPGPAFWEWFLLDCGLSGRRGPVAAAFADKASDLSAAEEQLLLDWLLTPWRPYEVTETLGSRGVLVKDLLAGTERHAGPLGVPAGLIRSDILVGRLVPTGRLWRPGMALLRLPGTARAELLAYLRTCYQMARPGRHVSVEDFVDGQPHLYHHFLLLRGPDIGGSTLGTVRLLPFAPRQAWLQGTDGAHIRAILDRQPGLECESVTDVEVRYRWVDGAAGLARGELAFGPAGVRITADTAEDLTHMQGELAAALQGLAGPAVESALPVASREPAGGVADGPAGARFLARMLDGWAETASPLLGDRTPEEYCRSQTGRQAVSAMLLDLEQRLVRQKRLGRAGGDVAHIRDRLGLPGGAPV
jgi:hypothetical protein